MQLVENFFNKLASDIDKTYFPTVKYYRDNKYCTECHYAIELFNNGCITYNVLIKRLAINCQTKPKIIKKIVEKYLISIN